MFFLFGAIDWILVAEGVKCKGKTQWTAKDGKRNGNEKAAKYRVENAVEQCAKACSGISLMFRLKDCDGTFCKCVCEIDVSNDGTCVLESALTNDQQLFKYVPKGMKFNYHQDTHHYIFGTDNIFKLTT